MGISHSINYQYLNKKANIFDIYLDKIKQEHDRPKKKLIINQYIESKQDFNQKLSEAMEDAVANQLFGICKITKETIVTDLENKGISQIYNDQILYESRNIRNRKCLALQKMMDTINKNSDKDSDPLEFKFYNLRDGCRMYVSLNELDK